MASTNGPIPNDFDALMAVHNHLRDHLTDGHWHDACRWCLRRRVHGGNGTEV